MSTSKKIVCIGEILWDKFGENKVAGGAPFNVAKNLKQLGEDVDLISGVGNDDLGMELLSVLENAGFSQGFVQKSEVLATSEVEVVGKGNEISYKILEPVAWDDLQLTSENIHLVEKAEALVFGSLMARQDVSKNTLFHFLESAPNAQKVFDINLRAPHYTKENIEGLLYYADFVKLNQEELELLIKWFQLSEDQEEALIQLEEEFNCPIVCLTRGGNGAILRFGGKIYSHEGYQVQVEDAVGAGDAFLGGLVSCLLSEKEPMEALNFACALGALIASKKGATPNYNPIEIDEILKRNC
ncbi:carbohydrate kinase family protein [Litoribacter populi]|uniref:carbohydrate kinase family protein n=1 Tax=Litoribacter populi TaxID=2598460 RepID=UPI00117C73A9|nr:carbohydrate kinase [Litoribacter populi]